MQYWSENHQIGWKAGKYLIGQAFAENPELQNLIFEASNTNGEQSRQIGKEAVHQWLDYRSRWIHTVILPDWTLKNGVILILPSSIARSS